jgi:DNA-binding GntR family transcriptional regulator
MQYQRFDNLMDSYDEHARILEAIRKSNKAEALEALKANLL